MLLYSSHVFFSTLGVAIWEGSAIRLGYTALLAALESKPSRCEISSFPPFICTDKHDIFQEMKKEHGRKKKTMVKIT